MAHDLATTTEGKTAMMYAGETPWHGLGTKLDEPASSEEAIDAAGLNYRVDLKPIYTGDGTLIPQRKAVVRDDSHEVLGVVGNSYQADSNCRHTSRGFTPTKREPRTSGPRMCGRNFSSCLKTDEVKIFLKPS